mgnify:CR=1 FL=1
MQREKRNNIHRRGDAERGVTKIILEGGRREAKYKQEGVEVEKREIKKTIEGRKRVARKQ